jgi:hypothetical protein
MDGNSSAVNGITKKVGAGLFCLCKIIGLKKPTKPAVEGYAIKSPTLEKKVNSD